ncbi:hypothetical protein N2152v2_004950 [Parachlorella kessleri]
MDYDLAKVSYAPEWRTDTPCGTVHYMAPEIVRHQKYSQAVDLWSLGVVLYILLSGRPPFDGKDREAVQAAIERGAYSTDDWGWEQVSLDAKDLLRRLLEVDPARRITAAECLQHPWLAPTSAPAATAASTAPARAGVTESSVGLQAGQERQPVCRAKEPPDQQQPSPQGASSTAADTCTDPELPSPANLRNTLTLSVRGRRMLARAMRAQALKSNSVGGGGGLLGLQQSGQLPAPVPSHHYSGRSPLRELFNFDLAPLRQQAGLGPGDPVQSTSFGGLPSSGEGPSSVDGGESAADSNSNGRGSCNDAVVGRQGVKQAASRGAAAGSWASSGRRSEDAVGSGSDLQSETAKLTRLRSQLEMVGTAGGLQDGRALAAEGQLVCPTSPTAAADSLQDTQGHAMVRTFQAAAATACGANDEVGDAFAGLEMPSVVEEGLHERDVAASDGGPGSCH